MALPTNILRAVQTYQEGKIAYLQNLFCFISTANTRFKNFQDLTANLGSTVTFDLNPRFTTTNGLVAVFQESEQRLQTLTVDRAVNTSYAFSAEQFIFNVKDYMEKFGKAAIYEIGSKIEADIAKTSEEFTYRFYGDGVTAINSPQQLAYALAYFRNYGAAKDNTKGYLSDIAVPSIVNTALGQYVLKRNEEYAQSWELGRFSDCDWYSSNLLPVHTSGTVGNGSTAAIQTLTVVSTNDPTGANITQINCTCDASLSGDPDVIKANDVAYFTDVTPALTVRYLTFTGHELSANPVQIRMTADAAASTTNVTINISPGLSAVAGRNQNINKNIVAGMKIKVMPSHRCGLITSGNPLFLAMPKLPNQHPFETANKSDPDSGISLRLTYGSLLGQNQTGFINDAIWGRTLVAENSMRILFPL